MASNVSAWFVNSWLNRMVHVIFETDVEFIIRSVKSLIISPDETHLNEFYLAESRRAMVIKPLCDRFISVKKFPR